VLFDWLVTGQVLAMNPAASIRRPQARRQARKTPILDAEQARQLLDSIDTAKLSGLRNRALIAVMVFSFARMSATVALKTEDYYLLNDHLHGLSPGGSTLLFDPGDKRRDGKNASVLLPPLRKNQQKLRIRTFLPEHPRKSGRTTYVGR